MCPQQFKHPHSGRQASLPYTARARAWDCGTLVPPDGDGGAGDKRMGPRTAAAAAEEALVTSLLSRLPSSWGMLGGMTSLLHVLLGLFVNSPAAYAIP
jgi:hypothetical protein